MIFPLLLISIVTNTTGEPPASTFSESCLPQLEALDNFLRPEAARCSRNLGVKIEELETCTASVADLKARLEVRDRVIGDLVAPQPLPIDPGWTGSEVFRAVAIGAGVALVVGLAVGVVVGIKADTGP